MEFMNDLISSFFTSESPVCIEPSNSLDVKKKQLKNKVKTVMEF
jgi:hypothetical protein